MDWINKAIKSYEELIKEGFFIFKNDEQKAISYANQNSTVSEKIKKMVLSNLKKNKNEI